MKSKPYYWVHEFQRKALHWNANSKLLPSWNVNKLTPHCLSTLLASFFRLMYHWPWLLFCTNAEEILVNWPNHLHQSETVANFILFNTFFSITWPHTVSLSQGISKLWSITIEDEIDTFLCRRTSGDGAHWLEWLRYFQNRIFSKPIQSPEY